MVGFLLAFVSGLQDGSLTVPPPPPRLADLPLVGQKLTEAWSLVATNMPAALAKYGQQLSGIAAWLASFAGGLAAGQLSFVLSFAVAAVLIAYSDGATNSPVACWNVSLAARHKARGWLR